MSTPHPPPASAQAPTPPVEQWTRQLIQAAELTQAGNFNASIRIIHDVIKELSGVPGRDIDILRIKAHGHQAHNAFRCGEFDAARSNDLRALEESRRIGYRAGIRTYKENLEVDLAVIEHIANKGPSGPICSIRAAIASAQTLSDHARYHRSIAVLSSFLADHRSTPEEILAPYMGKVCGLLGLNFFRLGRFDEAQTWTRSALEICTALDDLDGVQIYTLNLQVITRSTTSSIRP